MQKNEALKVVARRMLDLHQERVAIKESDLGQCVKELFCEQIDTQLSKLAVERRGIIACQLEQVVILEIQQKSNANSYHTKV